MEEQEEIGMFGFRPWTTEVKGKTVTMEIRPLKTKEMAIVLPLSKLFADKWKAIDPKLPVEEKAKIAFKDPADLQTMFDMQEKSAGILPNACRNLQGLKHGWKEVSEEFYYLNFAIGCLMKLISISVIGEEDAKN